MSSSQIKNNPIALVCIACLILFAYYIYMAVGPGGDGVIFASVVGALALIAGINIPTITNK